MYHREESFKPKNMPLAPHKVLEQKLLLVIVVENVIETRFFSTQPIKINTHWRPDIYGWYRHHIPSYVSTTQTCVIDLLLAANSFWDFSNSVDMVRPYRQNCGVLRRWVTVWDNSGRVHGSGILWRILPASSFWDISNFVDMVRPYRQNCGVLRRWVTVWVNSGRVHGSGI